MEKLDFVGDLMNVLNKEDRKEADQIIRSLLSKYHMSAPEDEDFKMLDWQDETATLKLLSISTMIAHSKERYTDRYSPDLPAECYADHLTLEEATRSAIKEHEQGLLTCGNAASAMVSKSNL